MGVQAVQQMLDPSHAVVVMWNKYGADVITSIITATQQRETVMKEVRIEGNQKSSAPPTCACWHAEKGQKSHEPNFPCRLPSRLVSALLAFSIFHFSQILKPVTKDHVSKIK